MISAELKWKNGLTSWVGGLERLFRHEGKSWFAKRREEKPTRKAPETEGERALYAAMGWEDVSGLDGMDVRDYQG